MQFTTVATVLALAGAAFANPAPQQVTVTASTTSVITITSCAPTVTDCPARTETVTGTTTYVYPVGSQAALAATGAVGTNAALPATGANAAGTGSGVTYNVPQPTGGYKGPSFTGGAGQMKAGAALAGVGAVAALLL